RASSSEDRTSARSSASPYGCAGKVSRADLCCSAFSSQRRVRAAGSATVLAATVNATELSPMRGTQLVIVIHTTLDCAVHRYRSCKAPPRARLALLHDVEAR